MGNGLLWKVSVALFVAFVLVSCLVAWYLLLRGPEAVAPAPTPVAAAAPVPAKEFQKLTPDQEARVKTKLERRFQERLAEEKKKWEASLPEQITEDEFVASVSP